MQGLAAFWGITFLLTCWLGCIICFGMIVAIGAGIAYGYNYCMAEWLTFGKSDVTVYMRRGQFGQNPLSSGERKPEADEVSRSQSGRRQYPLFEGDDSPAMNRTGEDYEDEQQPAVKPKPLGRSWKKAKDTRQYAEKLTKYADKPDTTEQEIQVEMATTAAGYYLLTSPPKRRITASPLVETTVWRSGTSEIIMRKFEPVDINPSSTPSHLRPLEGVRENDEFFYRVSNVPRRTTYEDDDKPTEPLVELRVADRKQAPYKYIPMRHWGVTTPETPVIPDELIHESGDEESAVYKNN